MHDRAADERDGDRCDHRDSEEVERPCVEAALRPGQVPAQDPAQEEVGASVRDDEEAPEDQRVGDPAEVVGPLQQLALAQVDDDLVLEVREWAVEPVLGSAEPEQSHEERRTPCERTEA